MNNLKSRRALDTQNHLGCLYSDMVRLRNGHKEKTADNLTKRILLQTCENFFLKMKELLSIITFVSEFTS